MSNLTFFVLYGEGVVHSVTQLSPGCHVGRKDETTGLREFLRAPKLLGLYVARKNAFLLNIGLKLGIFGNRNSLGDGLLIEMVRCIVVKKSEFYR